MSAPMQSAPGQYPPPQQYPPPSYTPPPQQAPPAQSYSPPPQYQAQPAYQQPQAPPAQPYAPPRPMNPAFLQGILQFIGALLGAVGFFLVGGYYADYSSNITNSSCNSSCVQGIWDIGAVGWILVGVGAILFALVILLKALAAKKAAPQ